MSGGLEGRERGWPSKFSAVLEIPEYRFARARWHGELITFAFPLGPSRFLFRWAWPRCNRSEARMNTPSRLDDRRPFHSALFFASTFFPRIFSLLLHLSSFFSPYFWLFGAGGKHARKMKTDFLTWKTLASPVMAYLPRMFFLLRMYSGLVLGLSLRDIRGCVFFRIMPWTRNHLLETFFAFET